MSNGSPADTLVPLPAKEVFAQAGLPLQPQSVDEVVESVEFTSNAIQDFRPVSRSLEWELSGIYWQSAGVLPFTRAEVPFLINNDGLSSEAAAMVLLAALQAAGSLPEKLAVMEVGAGTGLFARCFLDSFCLLCDRDAVDYYHRLTYYVTDGSLRTIRHWHERDLFRNHAERVVTGVLDAEASALLVRPDGSRQVLPALQAVFGNYLLDSLPGAMVRKNGEQVEELYVRTHFTSNAALAQQYTRLPLEEIRRLAASESPAARAELIPLLTLFDYEVAWKPVEPELAALIEELSPHLSAERAVVNYSAMYAIENWSRLLAPGGFVLVNDYGPVEGVDREAPTGSQRFGATTTWGVNFTLLERYTTARGLVAVKADGDESLPIHPRLFSRRELPEAAAVFRSRFGIAVHNHLDEPVKEARAHLSAGRKEDALESYKTALQRQPANWRLLGEVGEFVGLHLRDLKAGLDLVQNALSRNPCYSPVLWNVLGDFLYLLERPSDAEQAYRQAERIEAQEPRTCLNFAHLFWERGEIENGLEVVARGLAHDPEGYMRDRLLEKQQQLLAALTDRHRGEKDRLVKRVARFGAA